MVAFIKREWGRLYTTHENEPEALVAVIDPIYNPPRVYVVDSLRVSD